MRPEARWHGGWERGWVRAVAAAPPPPEGAPAGWAAYPGVLVAWHGEERYASPPGAPVSERSWERVVAAEVADPAARTAWHWRGARWTRFEWGTGDPPEGAQPVETRWESYVSTWDRRRARYRVCWRPVPEGLAAGEALEVLRPWVAFFVGWER